jgi:hypothetical protein
MPTKPTDERIKQLQARLRAAKQKGPLRRRLELVATKGAPAYAGGLAIGYVEEVHGPERGAQITAAMGIGGLAALFMLSPSPGSIVETVLSGATGAGMATMAREHGQTLGRYQRVKVAQRDLEGEEARRQELDAGEERETLNTEHSAEQTAEVG